MEPTPGPIPRNYRSLSAEAAQYDAEAKDAEVKIRELEAQMMSVRAKAKHARLQKQQIEAAREDNFHAEREQRQNAVRESITDHHIEGMRRCLAQFENTKDVLQSIVAGHYKAEDLDTMAVWFLRELMGNEKEFLPCIAIKILDESQSTIAAAKTKTIHQSPIRFRSLSLGTEQDPIANDHVNGNLVDLSVTEAGSISEVTCKIGEQKLVHPEAMNNKVSYDSFEIHGEEENNNKYREKIVIATTQGFIDLRGDDNSTAIKFKATAEDLVAETSDRFIEAQKTSDGLLKAEYNIIEHEDSIEVDDSTYFTPKRASTDTITELGNLAKGKRRSTEGSSGTDRLTTPTTTASNGRQSITSEYSTSNATRTPQPTTPLSKKVIAGTLAVQKATPAKTKAPVKRKRHEPEESNAMEVSESSVTPAPKKGKVIEVDVSAETPASKKVKSKDKEDGSIPLRVGDFIKAVKNISPEARANALFCAICGQEPQKPRISSCLHIYCVSCWKTQVKGANAGKKPSEQTCGRQGCQRFLGKAVIVPANLDLLNRNSEVWTNNTGKTAKKSMAKGDFTEELDEVKDADEENSISVQ